MSAYGDELEDSSTNPSTATTFEEVVGRRLSRRSVLTGSAATAVAFLTPGLLGTGTAQAAPRGAAAGPRNGPRALLGYEAVPLGYGDEVVVPRGYTATPFLAWGTPLFPGLDTRFDPATMSADEQARRVGMHHDGMHFFPLGGRSDRGLLVVNHEYTDEVLLHTGDPRGTRPATLTAQQREKSQNAHGVTVAEVQRGADGTWSVVVPSRYNRRVTAQTPMVLTGPAAGSDLLRTAADPTGTRVLGTINNCSHGYTPWGTYLVAEENFNGYFRTPTRTSGTRRVPDHRGFAQAEALQRYGVGGDSYRWAATDARFDLVPGAGGPEDANEVNRFGWVVELDPSDPQSVPAKRTALGRFKHEGAFVHVAPSGRAVVYTGDDQAGDYAYKFVGNRPWREYPAGQSPLDDGRLYVARFDDDGTGRWLELTVDDPVLAERFGSQAAVLVHARLAADALGATPMDRPEWTTVDPRTGAVYLTLTNNSGRTSTNGPNPRPSNVWGQVVRWYEDGGEHSATTFRWDLFLVAGQGRESGDGSTVKEQDALGSPDGLWADPDGRIWVQTDGTQPFGANDQMLAANPGIVDGYGAPELKRFLTGVRGCEVTGVITTPDQRTMFVNLQHPGDGEPDVLWPAGDGYGFPRSATVVVTKDDGGVIGS